MARTARLAALLIGALAGGAPARADDTARPAVQSSAGAGWLGVSMPARPSAFQTALETVTDESPVTGGHVPDAGMPWRSGPLPAHDADAAHYAPLDGEPYVPVLDDAYGSECGCDAHSAGCGDECGGACDGLCSGLCGGLDLGGTEARSGVLGGAADGCLESCLAWLLASPEPWSRRPARAGLFVGGVSGGELIPGAMDLGGGVLGGLRAGWDWSEFWGCEFRLGWGAIDLRNTVGDEDPRSADLVAMDGSVLVYPFNLGRVRPYFTAGVGLVNWDYTNEFGQDVSNTATAFPFGGGVMYRHNTAMTFRFDLLDHVIAGDDRTDTTHNLELLGGVEFRFGGPRRSYWPWEPSRW
jgi:hypothetical protein